MAYTDKEMKEAWDSLENSYRNQLAIDAIFRASDSKKSELI